MIYPPIGFFSFYGIGNGDEHGLYWPLGQEDVPPLVAFTSHDVGSVIPESSNVERFYRCELSRSDGHELCDYRWLAERATGRPQPEKTDESIASDDFRGLLAVDPESPFLLTAVGDLSFEDGDLERATEHYLKAVTRLPEYLAAHFALALCYRRMQRPAEVVVHLRKTLVSSTLFYGGSFWRETCLPAISIRNDWQRKSLMWLQRRRDCPPELEDDPFLREVNNLTFERGIKESRDFDILNALIDEYVARSQPLESVRLWLLYGERAAAETTSFRERLGLTPRAFGTRLIELLRLAGLTARADLAADMLSRLFKPDGRYL